MKLKSALKKFSKAIPLPTSGTVVLDFNEWGIPTMGPLTGNVTLTTSNLIPGNAYQLFLSGGASSYTITLPAAWRKYGGLTSPITLASGKEAVLMIDSLGTTDTGCRVFYNVES